MKIRNNYAGNTIAEVTRHCINLSELNLKWHTHTFFVSLNYLDMRSRSAWSNCCLHLLCCSATCSWLLSEHNVCFPPKGMSANMSFNSRQGKSQLTDVKNNIHFTDLFGGLNVIISKLFTVLLST